MLNIAYSVLCVSGGSGGGNGAAGGQGSFQDYVGPPPDYGSIYKPREFGGNGGSGGGSTSDLRCSLSAKQPGGIGGGFPVCGYLTVTETE